MLYPPEERHPHQSFGARPTLGALLVLFLLSLVHDVALAQDSKLEKSIGNLYGICLFESVNSNPFSTAAGLSRSSLAPGLTGFIENNLATIPLTPPSVKSEFRNGEIVNVVSGFTPVYTEGSSTVGKGHLFIGGNYSYFDLSKIRGQDLSDTRFIFGQDNENGSDVVDVRMPINVEASVFSIYGTYGITNRLDVGVALPITNISVRGEQTVFDVVARSGSSDTDCGYGPLSCDGSAEVTETPELSLENDAITGVSSLTETVLSTLSIRAKYRFHPNSAAGNLGLLLDIRVPTRGEDSVLGKGDFGMRFMVLGERHTESGFTPYFNIGGQAWNGDASGSFNVAGGFTQMFAQKASFSFDLLGKFDVKDSPFLEDVDDLAGQNGSAVIASTIPSVNRDHKLDAAIGLQYAFTVDVHAYGSAMFSLLDRGLSASVVPTFGLAWHY